MAANAEIDAVDRIVEDVEREWPELEVIGLPIVGRVLRLAQLLQARREEQLAPYGLTAADFDVLASLRRRGVAEAVNVRDLQHSMMLSSGGMTKRLDRLESTGLLERHPDPGDRRGVLIRLSPGGLRLIDEVLPTITATETELVAGAIGKAADRRAVERGLRALLVTQES